MRGPFLAEHEITRESDPEEENYRYSILTYAEFEHQQDVVI
tara:strand:+ start:158 stop:280 length:123 start_codon:yes stop_codon:yes gene_type:complete